MSHRNVLTFTLVGLASIAFMAGCGNGYTPQSLPVSVSVTPLSSSVVAGGMVSFTAQIVNDSANKGVTWTVTCATAPCGSVSPTSTQSTVPTTYTAPGTPPASQVMVTITATSASDSTKSASAKVAFDTSIVVVVSASVNPVGAGGTALISAVVNNDPANNGVDPNSWKISPATGAGTLSGATSSSVTYTAPAAAPPNDVQVTITATSASDSTMTGNVVITFATIAVVLSPSVNPVGAGGTSQISAVVNNDPTNMGVNPNSWSISPATGAGALSGATSSSVTYTAPATAPPNDVQVTITAASASDATKIGSSAITFAAIVVALSTNLSSVQAQGTATITATVSFDPANAGVNPASWTITSPTTGGGTLSGATNNSVTYTAPSTPPTNDLPVNITAAATSDSTKVGSTSLTVPAITISVTPASALIPVNNGSLQFTSVVHNDPTAPPQATWTTVQNGTLCTSGCGTFSPSTTASGAASTYTPPSTVPANPAVMVTATSATDTTKSAGAAIKLTNGTVQIVPDDLNFGAIKPNQSRSLTAVLTNTGSTALAISSITITGTISTSFLLTKNSCGSSVATGTSCQLGVTFRPTTQNHFSAMLTISDSSTDSPQQVSLEGVARLFRLFGNAAAMDMALSTNKTPSVPAPTGPSPVGTRLLDLVDSTRNDPFLGNGTKRELLVRMWYPAESAVSCSDAEYTSQRVWNDFSRLAGVPLPQVTTNSCWNTPVAAGSHPVVIFTHGYTGTFTDYTFVFEDLASRGYIVASVDHTYEATAVEFPDGRFAESVFGSHLGTTVRGDEAAMEFAVSVRLRDLRFVVDELDLLNSGADAQLAGKLDMTRVALAGHSLGGLTAILGVQKDPRFRAGIVIDGAMPKSSLTDIETPMLILAAGRDTWTEEEQQLWSSLRGPRIAVNLRGTEHVTPSDLIWLAMGAVKTGTAGPQATIAAVRNYIAAFLDANLLDKSPDQLLTETSSENRDAVVTLRNQLLRAKN